MEEKKAECAAATIITPLLIDVNLSKGITSFGESVFGYSLTELKDQLLAVGFESQSMIVLSDLGQPLVAPFTALKNYSSIIVFISAKLLTAVGSQRMDTINDHERVVVLRLQKVAATTTTTPLLLSFHGSFIDPYGAPLPTILVDYFTEQLLRQDIDLALSQLVTQPLLDRRYQGYYGVILLELILQSLQPELARARLLTANRKPLPLFNKIKTLQLQQFQAKIRLLATEIVQHMAQLNKNQQEVQQLQLELTDQADQLRKLQQQHKQWQRHKNRWHGFLNKLTNVHNYQAKIKALMAVQATTSQRHQLKQRERFIVKQALNNLLLILRSFETLTVINYLHGLIMVLDPNCILVLYAVKEGDVPLAKKLLISGVDPRLTDHNGLDILAWAHNMNLRSLISYLQPATNPLIVEECVLGEL